MKPPLRIVRTSPAPLLTDSDERGITDRLLMDDAVRFAADMLEPERHHHLTPSQWDSLCGWKAGEVSRHVFDASVVGGKRSVLKAREEIARVVGLYLALDRTLADLDGKVAGDGPA